MTSFRHSENIRVRIKVGARVEVRVGTEVSGNTFSAKRVFEQV